MGEIRVYQGQIVVADVYYQHINRIDEKVVFLDSSNSTPLSEQVAYDVPINRSRLLMTVRYWISDWKMTKDELDEALVTTVIGGGRAYGFSVYSEITPDYETTQELTIGGHDIIEELITHKGKWLYMEIEWEQDVYVPPPPPPPPPSLEQTLTDALSRTLSFPKSRSLRVQITVIAYGLADDLVKLFALVGDAPGIKWRLFLHSDIPHVEATCNSLIERYPNIYYYPYKVNRGLSRTWNEGITASYLDGADVAMIINDDMLPGVGDVQRVAQAAMDNPDAAIIKCMGRDLRSGQWTPMEFGLTAITKTGWQTIGAFDENIWPIYWEDIDWDRRRRLSGLSEFIVQDTSAVHAGSKTSVTVPGLLQQTDAWYNANLAYYRKKWGAAHTEGETFDVPFNDPEIVNRFLPYYLPAWFIPPWRSGTPYGDKYDREDVPRG